MPKRVPKTLSFTNMSTYFSNREEWFLRYLAGTKPPKIPQTPAMSVGSAFDAMVKSELNKALGLPEENQSFQELFDSQVEEHNRDFAITAGKNVFEAYVYSGAFDTMLKLMEKSSVTPQFEFNAEGTIEGVPLMGKPDLAFSLGDTKVIGDWKVKGYCSKYPNSPTKGYRICLDGSDFAKQSKSHKMPHKAYNPSGPHEVCTTCLSNNSKDYAAQVSLYSWLTGNEIGDDSVIFMMEEIVCKYSGEALPPTMRVASHRNHVSTEVQRKIMDNFHEVWNSVTSGHVFTDMSREESDARCEVLDLATEHMDESYFTEVTRSNRFKG